MFSSVTEIGVETMIKLYTETSSGSCRFCFRHPYTTYLEKGSKLFLYDPNRSGRKVTLGENSGSSLVVLRTGGTLGSLRERGTKLEDVVNKWTRE